MFLCYVIIVKLFLSQLEWFVVWGIGMDSLRGEGCACIPESANFGNPLRGLGGRATRQQAQSGLQAGFYSHGSQVLLLHDFIAQQTG